MDNEMMPLLGFLLQSEDLKKQSDRIVQEIRVESDLKKQTEKTIIEEIRIGTDIKKLSDEYTKSVDKSEMVGKMLDLQLQNSEWLEEVKNVIDQLNEKIDKLIESKPGNRHTDRKNSKK